MSAPFKVDSMLTVDSHPNSPPRIFVPLNSASCREGLILPRARGQCVCPSVGSTRTPALGSGKFTRIDHQRAQGGPESTSSQYLFFCDSQSPIVHRTKRRRGNKIRFSMLTRVRDKRRPSILTPIFSFFFFFSFLFLHPFSPLLTFTSQVHSNPFPSSSPPKTNHVHR